MKRDKTLTLGQFKELTKDLPDNTAIMVVSGGDTALALGVYPFETSLDGQRVFLLDMSPYDYVRFETF